MIDRDEVRRLKAELDLLEAPPVRKCHPPSPHEQSKHWAKGAMVEAMDELGLDNSSAARLLDVSEGAVRAWIDPHDMRRHPPLWALYALGREARLVCARGLIKGVEDESAPSTGMTG